MGSTEQLDDGIGSTLVSINPRARHSDRTKCECQLRPNSLPVSRLFATSANNWRQRMMDGSIDLSNPDARSSPSNRPYHPLRERSSRRWRRCWKTRTAVGRSVCSARVGVVNQNSPFTHVVPISVQFRLINKWIHKRKAQIETWLGTGDSGYEKPRAPDGSSDQFEDAGRSDDHGGRTSPSPSRPEPDRSGAAPPAAGFPRQILGTRFMDARSYRRA